MFSYDIIIAIIEFAKRESTSDYYNYNYYEMTDIRATILGTVIIVFNNRVKTKRRRKKKKKELKNKNDFKLWDACHVERRPFCFPVRGCACAQ